MATASSLQVGCGSARGLVRAPLLPCNAVCRQPQPALVALFSTPTPVSQIPIQTNPIQTHTNQNQSNLNQSKNQSNPRQKASNTGTRASMPPPTPSSSPTPPPRSATTRLTSRTSGGASGSRSTRSGWSPGTRRRRRMQRRHGARWSRTMGGLRGLCSRGTIPRWGCEVWGLGDDGVRGGVFWVP